MAFENPCSLEHMDVVLPNTSDYNGWIATQPDDKDSVLCVENSNGYSFIFYDDTEEELHKSVAQYTDTKYNTKQVSVLNVLHSWRALIYKNNQSLVIGCKDYLCDTALVASGGMLYPHAFSLISYLLDENNKPMIDEWGSLICAGSPSRLIQSSCAENQDLMLGIYSKKISMRTEPLIFLAKQYKSLLCEGSMCNVPLAIAHSYHARSSKNV
jgi:hypothetical protein